MIRAEGAGIGVNFTIDAYDPLCGHRRLVELHNFVTDAGLNLQRDWALGQAPPLDRFVLGTGAVQVTSSDVTLPGEEVRDLFTQTVKGAGTLTIKYYLSTLTGNGKTFTKAGLVAGNETLFAGVNFPPAPKTSAEAWTLTWVLTFSDLSRGA